MSKDGKSAVEEAIERLARKYAEARWANASTDGDAATWEALVPPTKPADKGSEMDQQFKPGDVFECCGVVYLQTGDGPCDCRAIVGEDIDHKTHPPDARGVRVPVPHGYEVVATCEESTDGACLAKYAEPRDGDNWDFLRFAVPGAELRQIWLRRRPAEQAAPEVPAGSKWRSPKDNVHTIVEVRGDGLVKYDTAFANGTKIDRRTIRASWFPENCTRIDAPAEPEQFTPRVATWSDVKMGAVMKISENIFGDQEMTVVGFRPDCPEHGDECALTKGGNYHAKRSNVNAGRWTLIRPAPEVSAAKLPADIDEVAPFTASDVERISRAVPTCAACSRPITGRPLELDEGAVKLCPGDACVNRYARQHTPRRYDPDAEREACRGREEGDAYDHASGNTTHVQDYAARVIHAQRQRMHAEARDAAAANGWHRGVTMCGPWAKGRL